jgi:hypothetical protein
MSVDHRVTVLSPRTRTQVPGIAPGDIWGDCVASAKDRAALLRRLAEQRNSSMIETLDAALEALRRQDFFAEMAKAEATLREDPEAWDAYEDEVRAWQEAP